MTNLSPLQPVKRKNLKEYREFRSAVRSLVSEYTEQISEIKKASPRYQVQNSETLQRVYSHGLELLLVEASQGEKKLTPFQKLTDAVGVVPDDLAWEEAILKYIVHVREIPENAANILATVREKTEFQCQDLDHIRDRVAYRLCGFEVLKRFGSYDSNLRHLVKLTGNGKFSDLTINSIQAIVLNEMSNGKFSMYDNIKEISPEATTIPESKKDHFKTSAVSWADTGKFELVRSLEQRVPGSFTESDATNTAALFLAGFRFDLYEGLSKHFSISEFNDSQKDRIRDRVIHYLMQNPNDYTQVAKINANAKMSVTATSDELKPVVDSYFKRSWNRTNPLEVAKALNQQLDPSQVNQRYIDLIKKYLEDEHGRFNGESYANDRWKNRDEAKELFNNTKIPIAGESVQDIIRFTKHSERLVYVANFIQVGYKPTEEDAKWFREAGYNHDDWGFFEKAQDTLKITPTNDDLESLISRPDKKPQEKLNWIGRFKHKYNYRPTDAIGNEIFRQIMTDNPNYSDVNSAISVLGLPPQSYIERIVTDSLSRSDFGLDAPEWTEPPLNTIIKKLRGNNLVHLTEDQSQRISSYIKRESSLVDFSRLVKRAGDVYGVTVTLNDEEQNRLLAMINREVGDKAYTQVKHQSGTYWNNSGIYSKLLDDKRRIIANEKLKVILSTGDDIYQACYYALVTGARPNLSMEEYQRTQTQFGKYRHRFIESEKKSFGKMLELWKPQTGGEK